MDGSEQRTAAPVVDARRLRSLIPRWEVAIPPLALYFAAMSMMYPLIAQLVFRLVCDEYQRDHDTSSTDDGDCSNDSIAAKASWIVTIVVTISYIPALLMSGNYGDIIDVYGRRVVSAAPFVGTIVYATTAVLIAATKPANFAYILGAAAAFDGLCGMHSTVSMSLYSYVADTFAISDAAERVLSLTPSGASDADDVHGSEPQSDADAPLLDGIQSAPLPAKSANLLKPRAFSLMLGSIFAVKIIAPTASGTLAAQVDPSFTLSLGLAVLLLVLGLTWVLLLLPETVSHLSSAVRAVGEAERISGRRSAAEGGEAGAGRAGPPTLQLSVFRTVHNVYWLLAEAPLWGKARRDGQEHHRSGSVNGDFVKTEDVLHEGLALEPQSRHVEHVVVHMDAVPLLTVAYFLFYVAFIADLVILVVYIVHVYHWRSDTIGFYDTTDAVVQLTSIVAVPYVGNRYVVPAINGVGRWWCGPTSRLLVPLWCDIHWVLMGHASRAAYLVLFGSTTEYSTVALFSLLGVLLFAGSLVPRTKALLSNSILSVNRGGAQEPLLQKDPGSAGPSKEEFQSRMFSALSSLEVCASLIAPALSSCYAFTVHTSVPGSLFVAMGGLCVVSSGLVAAVLWRRMFDVVGAEA